MRWELVVLVVLGAIQMRMYASNPQVMVRGILGTFSKRFLFL